MATVTGLASHLLSLLQPPATESSASVPKVDAARLAFYHFLKNMCEPGEPLSTATLDRFFRRSMTHAHWVENKSALFSEVATSLQHFSNQTGEALPLPPFAQPSDLQVLRAESFRSLERVVESWIHRNQSPTDQIKILRDQDEKLIVCRLTLDRSLSVHIFDRWLALTDGHLGPLSEDMVVHYTPELAIDSNRISQIEIARHTVARFKTELGAGPSAGLKGVAVRGFTYQKAAAFEGGELHRHPTLFYPLKRIEQFFVNRATDPMYIELTSLLEKASDLLSQKHPESLRFAEAAMERGRLAFEQVFVEDRLLRLLLENLERALLLEKRPIVNATPSDVSPSPLGDLSHLPALNVDIAQQVSDKVGSHLGLRLKPGEEFIEPIGPDLVELQETRFQEAEACETIAPVNQGPLGQSLMGQSPSLR